MASVLHYSFEDDVEDMPGALVPMVTWAKTKPEQKGPFSPEMVKHGLADQGRFNNTNTTYRIVSLRIASYRYRKASIATSHRIEDYRCKSF